MRSEREAVELVHGSLDQLPAGRWLLAVSGGRDSMALLAAMHRCRPGEIAAVATFDHGTGPDATRASSLVSEQAAALGLELLKGGAPLGTPATEAHWRAVRWRFLLDGGRQTGSTVLTAHTRDDQIETVVIRLLRGSGARGLAGMAEVDPLRSIRRPLLGVGRAELAAYARARGVSWVEDRSNESRVHLRNRVRLDLLPALERAQPGFSEWCLDLSARCRSWREGVDLLAASIGAHRQGAGCAVVPVAGIAALAEEEQAVLWPAIAALAELPLDRRAIRRLARWAPHAAPRSWIPLAGGALVERNGSAFVVRRHDPRALTPGNDERRS